MYQWHVHRPLLSGHILDSLAYQRPFKSQRQQTAFAGSDCLLEQQAACEGLDFTCRGTVGAEGTEAAARIVAA